MKLPQSSMRLPQRKALDGLSAHTVPVDPSRVEADIHVLELLATVKAYPGNHTALHYSFHWSPS
jgi:hypothetical protein